MSKKTAKKTAVSGTAHPDHDPKGGQIVNPPSAEVLAEEKAREDRRAATMAKPIDWRDLPGGKPPTTYPTK